jgi:hypothetical protein
VSYSMREPPWEPTCECKYDEARDEMDREDCPFHCDQTDDVREVELQPVQRKLPMIEIGVGAPIRTARGSVGNG